MAIGTCLDAVVTLVTGVGSSPENRAVPAAGEGRKRIEGSGYTRFGSGTLLQTGWKTRSVGMHIGGRTFVKAATNAKDVKRGRFDPVHHLWFGRRNDRGEVEFHGYFLGVCCGVVRYDKTSPLGWNGCSYGICRRARVCSRFQCSKHRPARVQICGCWGE